MKNMMIFVVLVAAVGCVSEPSFGGAADPATAVGNGGCPPGQQPVFEDDGKLICGAVPEWPPEASGSRSAQAGCALQDGEYHVIWSSDEDIKTRPAFTYMKLLTVAGDLLSLTEVTYTSTTAPPIVTVYPFHLGWVDAGHANVWEDGDTDTWEFIVWRDCETGRLEGTRTLSVPFYSPGRQVQTWNLTSVPG